MDTEDWRTDEEFTLAISYYAIALYTAAQFPTVEASLASALVSVVDKARERGVNPERVVERFLAHMQDTLTTVGPDTEAN